jgi:hypothetical protein
MLGQIFIRARVGQVAHEKFAAHSQEAR